MPGHWPWKRKKNRNGEIGRHDNKRCSLVFARLRFCDLASRSNINQNNNVHIGDTCYLKKYFVYIPHNSKGFTGVGVPSLLSLVYVLLNAVIEIVTYRKLPCCDFQKLSYVRMDVDARAESTQSDI